MSSEKAQKTCSDPIFWKKRNFCDFFAKNRENCENRKKTAISETRKNKNFGKRQFPKLAKTKISEKNV